MSFFLTNLILKNLIRRYSKDGGCEELCSYIMFCGHECAKTCHGSRTRHSCAQPCTRVCVAGHPCQRMCGEPCGNCNIRNLDRKLNIIILRMCRIQNKSINLFRYDEFQSVTFFTHLSPFFLKGERTITLAYRR